MLVKVCGLTRNDNIEEICSLKGIDMVGFNFYPLSPRFTNFQNLRMSDNPKVTSVGVFVGEKIEKVKEIVEVLSLNYVQLHSLEDQKYIDQCNEFCKVIKAVGIESEKDIKRAKEFTGCTYLLFDKKSKEHGGTGKKFDWDLISKYEGNSPFLLAGGIGPEDVISIKKIDHPMFAGIDINSLFEDSPGIKNVKLISEFLENLEK
jgi:phosphoribosylanthranilate isomerase